ncbi:hypothetical protein ACJMK2_042240 [Sinanodonta woodiana]|uniref:Uncharacterized protein n=1 Tax=Sinanodonta woodiana TaxID=1069815 RepID=A0ABD3W9Y5_SINWO
MKRESKLDLFVLAKYNSLIVHCENAVDHYNLLYIWTPSAWIKVKFAPNEISRWSPECEVCHYKFVMSQKIKLTMSRCPEIAAQDKLRHVIFCFSIIFMLLCLNIFFVAFANLRDRTEKSKNSKGDDKDDILLVVFGVSFFVAIMVAFISQRHATLSIIQVAKQFFRNSKEWTVTSIGKQLDEAAEEEV